MFRKLVLLLAFVFIGSSAHAVWYTATATWQIGGASPTYKGVASSKEEALAIARNNCKNAQSINDWKNYCDNLPTRLNYAESPDGSYAESCDNCQTEGGKLVCDLCKPKLERRELELASCPAGSPIENCFGDLTCGACKTVIAPPNTTPGFSGDMGVCDKHLENCHEPY